MSGRFFLDTNVFISSFDKAAPQKAQSAVELIHKAISGRQGVISDQVVQEFFDFALRKAKINMTVPDAEEYLRITFRPLLAVHSSEVFFNEALHLQAMHRFSWYDSLIVAAALKGECQILYTEDLQHGQRFGNLQVRNPFL